MDDNNRELLYKDVKEQIYYILTNMNGEQDYITLCDIYRKNQFRSLIIECCLEKGKYYFLEYIKNHDLDIKIDETSAKFLLGLDKYTFYGKMNGIYESLKSDNINHILPQLAKQNRIDDILYLTHNFKVDINLQEVINCLYELSKKYSKDDDPIFHISKHIAYLYENDLKNYYNYYGSSDKKEIPKFIDDVLDDN
jgi:hypothetical protein